MESLSEVAVSDFEAALTPPRVRLLQVIHAAFGLSMVTFGLVVVALHRHGSFGSGTAPAAAPLIVQVMTGLNFVGFCTCWTLGARFFSAHLSSARLARAVRQEFRDPAGRPIADPAEKCVAIIRKASFWRLLCLDVAASFSFATCLVAVVLGVMQGRPVYWINAAPGLLLIAYLAITFPTASRLRTLFLVKIAGAWRPA